jgi:hypothetical protein
MAVFSFDSTATQRRLRARDTLNASRQTRPALAIRWEQDARGRFVCRWVFACPASSISPPD